MVFPLTVISALARAGLHPPGHSPFPEGIRPMLAEAVVAPFNDPAWMYEPKWDGFRVVAMIRDGSVRLLSRNLLSVTDLFRPVTEALTGFPASLVLDGEVVVLDERGLPDFEALQQWLRPAKRRPSGRLVYMVFDCLYANNHSLISRGVEDRHAVLRALARTLAPQTVRVTEPLSGMDGRAIFRQCAKVGLEGVVAKRRASVYRPGARSQDWVTIPVRRREEFVVGGYVTAGRRGLHSIVLGQYDRTGKLAYAGILGAGLTEGFRQAMLRELQAVQRKSSPFASAPTLPEHRGDARPDPLPHWVKPALVVEVEYPNPSRTDLRHAVLKGLRPDKRADEVLAKSSILPPTPRKAARPLPPPRPPAASGRS
ncbi:MAG TPA: non-homologous end-joining DNA ligase [bacterium]|nr:non-homologous end-joining DNA ligase [bacterium]